MKKAALLFILALGLAACGAQKQHAQVQKAGEALRLDVAQLYIEKGARQQAVPLLRRILASEPNNHGARVLYGSVLRDLGLYPQAKAQLARVLEAVPNAAEAHAALGILFDLQREFDKAKTHHNKAVALAPGRADFVNNLGFSYFLSKQHEFAVKCFEQALSLDPGLALAYNNLGFTYGSLGDFDKAERTFRTALGDAGAAYNMALVYDQKGKKKKAARMRRRAFDRDPELRAVYLESKKESMQ